MRVILVYFWQLCMLRESPERIPPSVTIACAATLTYLVVGMASFAVNRPSLPFFTIVGVSMTSLVIEGSALYGLLAFKRLSHRYLSSMTAIFACNSILLALLLPFNFVLIDMEEGLMLDIVNAVSVVCLFWWLAIVGHILKKSAGISLVQGIVLAFVIELLVAVTIRSFFQPFAS